MTESSLKKIMDRCHLSAFLPFFFAVWFVLSAIAFSFESPHKLYALGIELFQKRDYPAALENFTQSYRLDPSLYQALFWIGRSLEELGRHKEAIGFFQEMAHQQSLLEKQEIPELPNLEDSSKRLGEIEKKQDKARELHEEGDNLLADGRWQQAASCFGRAAEIFPDRADYHLKYGKALFDTGLYKQSAGALRKAQAIQPDNPDILKALAASYERLGDMTLLIDIYKKLIMVLPQDSKIRERWQKFIKEKPVEGKIYRVLRREGERLYIQGGLEDGMSMGMEYTTKFLVFRPGPGIQDLKTGQIIGQGEEIVVGELFLMKVDQKVSTAQITSEYRDGIRVGDGVRLK